MEVIGLKALLAVIAMILLLLLFKSEGSDVGGRSRDKAFRVLSLVALRQESCEAVVEREAPEKARR